MHRDIDLRRINLRVTDPYKQEGLVSTIPVEITLVDVLNTYSFERWPHEKVRCVKCNGHRHKHGFTALLSNGAKALFGSKCGEEEFGENWAQATARLREQSRRQNFLLQLDILVPHLPKIRQGLKGWRPACDSIEYSHKRFKNNLGYVYEALCQLVARGETQLKIYEKKTIQKTKRGSGESRFVTEWIPQTISILQGGAYFKNITPTEILDKADAILKQIEIIAGDTSRFDTNHMSILNKQLNNVYRELRQIVDMRKGAILFFAPDHLKLVAYWATRTDSNYIPGRYKAQANELHNLDTGKSMALPPSFAPIDENILLILQSTEKMNFAAA